MGNEGSSLNQVVIFIVLTLGFLILVIALINSRNSVSKTETLSSTTTETDSTATEENTTGSDNASRENPYDAKVTELVIETVEEGEGAESKDGDTLSVHYTGTLMDGSKFDSSVDRGTPFEFQLGAGRVIQGWEEGMKGMKVGEKRKLTIPSKMGYGENGSQTIPSNSPLLFDVELLEIK